MSERKKKTKTLTNMLGRNETTEDQKCCRAKPPSFGITQGGLGFLACLLSDLTPKQSFPVITHCSYLHPCFHE